MHRPLSAFDIKWTFSEGVSFRKIKTGSTAKRWFDEISGYIKSYEPTTSWDESLVQIKVPGCFVCRYMMFSFACATSSKKDSRIVCVLPACVGCQIADLLYIWRWIWQIDLVNPYLHREMLKAPNISVASLTFDVTKCSCKSGVDKGVVSCMCKLESCVKIWLFISDTVTHGVFMLSDAQTGSRCKDGVLDGPIF